MKALFMLICILMIPLFSKSATVLPQRSFYPLDFTFDESQYSLDFILLDKNSSRSRMWYIIFRDGMDGILAISNNFVDSSTCRIQSSSDLANLHGDCADQYQKLGQKYKEISVGVYDLKLLKRRSYELFHSGKVYRSYYQKCALLFKDHRFIAKICSSSPDDTFEHFLKSIRPNNTPQRDTAYYLQEYKKYLDLWRFNMAYKNLVSAFILEPGNRDIGRYFKEFLSQKIKYIDHLKNSFLIVDDTKLTSNYNLSPEQIDYMVYENGQLTVGIKRKYWKSIFDFTRQNIHKKIQIQIAGINVHPHVYEALFDTFQISSDALEGANKELKRLIQQKPFTKTSKIPIDEEIDFLEKMLQKDPQNYDVRHLLIGKYHQKNTVPFSKLCIDTYEKTVSKKIKILLSKYNYEEIYDCYIDLNATQAAHKLLRLVRNHIDKNSLYDLLRKEAYLYKLEHHYNKAKLLYKQSIDALKNINIFKGLSDIREVDKESLRAFKTSETAKIKKTIHKIDKLQTYAK